MVKNYKKNKEITDYIYDPAEKVALYFPEESTTR